MAVSTLAIGGAHPATQVFLATAVLGLLALNAAASRGIRWVPFATVALVGVGISCLQLIPLPSVLVQLISPRAVELRGEIAGAVPSFTPLSLDVPATILEICKGCMYAGMLLVVGRFANRDRRARPLLMSVAALGVLLAIIAGVQRAIETDTILGVYQVRSLPGSFVFGTFVNGNHAASVLVLSALVSIGFAFEAGDGRRMLFLGAAAVSSGALVLTQSRGGVVAFVAGGFVLVTLLLSRRYGRWRALLLGVVIAGAISASVLIVADGLRGRFLRGDNSHLWENQKTRGWAAAWDLWRDFPWTGVGRGAFEAPASAYRTDSEGVRLVYPENLPLQLLTEWGILFTLAIGAMFVVSLVRLGRRWGKQEPAVLAAGCGVLAVILHDMVDFGLEMPGIAMPTVVALGVVVARAYGGRTTNANVNPNATANGKLPRLPLTIAGALGFVWIAALFGGVWATGHTLTEDGQRAREAMVKKSPQARAVIDEARARHPADYYLELLAATHKMSSGEPGVLRHLNRALRLNPAHGETHALTGRWLARLGRRPQAALEFRLAREHGTITEFNEIFAAVGAAAVDAVPQQPEVLISLSQHLGSLGHNDVADAAARRAAERSKNSEAALTHIIELAMATGEPRRMIAAAQFVLDAQPAPFTVVLAARALFKAGQAAAANDALSKALLRLPDDPGLVLAAARLRLEFGDPQGARLLLSKKSEAQFHLADLVTQQDLLAQIADKTGDPDAAVIARARGRMFSRRLAESQSPAGYAGRGMSSSR